MIAFVNGIVKIIRSDRVVLDVHGVGYEVYLANALSQKKMKNYFYIPINMFVRIPFYYLVF